ncbi:MAG: recombinase zinc beta ribbon domain-containing protein [Ignavibacteriae bacterium]|nr:recombinase zinc beta ribbon domain-containing protein [Ignavibacteriota bacterium]
MKCSHCGFNFSGQRYYKDRLYYYQDSGYVNKGRSVCTSYLIRKEKIEEFIIRNIKENILDAHCETKLRKIIGSRLRERAVKKEPSLEKIEIAINDTDIQIRNLVDAIAKGVNVDTVLTRVQELEVQKSRLQAQRQGLRSLAPDGDGVTQLTDSILAELLHFEQVFDQANTFEKKSWIRRFVPRITVDRSKNQIVCQIMKIPMVSHSLMTTLLPSESSINVVAGTGLEPATFGL